MAIKKIKETLQWRKEFGVDKIVSCFDEDGDAEMRAVMEREAVTGKIYVRGFDNEGRAAMYMRPQNENTHVELDNMRHLVYNLERARACTRKRSGLEKIVLMIDYEGFRIRDSPPMSTTRYTLNILQNHYPECMYKSYIMNAGVVFRTFYGIVKPFLDPVTKEKIVICHGKSGPEKLSERFDLANVEKCGGGGIESDFDSKEYFSRPFDEPL